MQCVSRYKQCYLLIPCLYYTLCILPSVYGTYYWNVNRHKRLEKGQWTLWSVIWQMKWEEKWQSLPKLKNYTGKYLLGLYVSRHFTFRIGSAYLIERERQGKREKLLQTRAWFIKSSSLFVRASSLCMRNSEHVRRRMSRPTDRRRGMVVLNSAGNQLVKLNIKKNPSRIIMCGKVIFLQLATSRLTYAQAHINTAIHNGKSKGTGCEFGFVCRNIVSPLK